MIKTIGCEAGRKMTFMSKKDIQRFMGKIDFTLDEDKCWEWNAGKFKDMYGTFWCNDESFLAHRISFYLRTRQDIEEKLIIHSCHNTSCVNPNHLSIGTPTKNVQQSYDKNGKEGVKGSRNKLSKLTEEQVYEIRLLGKTRNWIQQEIADKFNINRSNISYILSRKTWTHI